MRRALKIEYEGSGILSYSVSIFFRSKSLGTLHNKGWGRFYRLVDVSGHWSDLIAIDGRELWRLTCFHVDPETEMDSLDVEALLIRAAGSAFPHEVLSVLPWKRRELVATSYGRGRVFIAGDAAHQMSPTGGIGMNTGIGDAVDIGWKLAAVLQGWGGSHLLESYEIERKPVAVSSVTVSSETYVHERRFQPIQRLRKTPQKVNGRAGNSPKLCAADAGKVTNGFTRASNSATAMRARRSFGLTKQKRRR